MTKNIKIIIFLFVFFTSYILLGIGFFARAQVLDVPPASNNLSSGLTLTSPNNNILGIDKVRTGSNSNPEAILGVFGEKIFSNGSITTFVRIRIFNGSGNNGVGSWDNPSSNSNLDLRYGSDFGFYSLVMVNDFDNTSNNSLGGGFITVAKRSLNSDFFLLIYYFDSGSLRRTEYNIHRFLNIGTGRVGSEDWWMTFKHFQNNIAYFVGVFSDDKNAGQNNQVWFDIKNIILNGQINTSSIRINHCSYKNNNTALCAYYPGINEPNPTLATYRNFTPVDRLYFRLLDVFSLGQENNYVVYNRVNVLRNSSGGLDVTYEPVRIGRIVLDTSLNRFSITQLYQIPQGNNVTGSSLYYANNTFYVLYSQRIRSNNIDYDSINIATCSISSNNCTTNNFINSFNVSNYDVSIGDFSVIGNNLYFSYYYDDQDGRPDRCSGYRWYRINSGSITSYTINCSNQQIPYGGVFQVVMNGNYYYFVGNNFRMFAKDQGYIAPHNGEGMVTNQNMVWHYVYRSIPSIPDSCQSMEIRYTPINSSQEVSRSVNSIFSDNTIIGLPRPGSVVTISSVRHSNAPNFSTFWMRPANLMGTQLDDRCNYYLINSNNSSINIQGNLTIATFRVPDNIYNGITTNMPNAPGSNCSGRVLDFSQGIVFGVNYVDWVNGNRWCRNAGPSPSGGMVYEVSGSSSRPASPAQNCSNYCVIQTRYNSSVRCVINSPSGNVDLLNSGLSLSFRINDAVFSNISSISRYSIDLSNISIQDDNLNDTGTLSIIRSNSTANVTNNQYTINSNNDGVNLNYNINIPRSIFARTEFNNLAGSRNIPILLRVTTNNQLTFDCNINGQNNPPGGPPGNPPTGNPPATGTFDSLSSFQISSSCITPYRWNITIIPLRGTIERIYYRFNNSAPLTGITNEMTDQQITELLNPLTSSQVNPLVRIRVLQGGRNDIQIDATRLTDTSLTLYVIVRDNLGRRNVVFSQNGTTTLGGQSISDFSNRFDRSRPCMNLFYSTQRGDVGLKNTQVGNPNGDHKIFDYIVSNSSIDAVFMVLGVDYRISRDNNTYINNIQAKLSNLQNNLGNIVEKIPVRDRDSSITPTPSGTIVMYEPETADTNTEYTINFTYPTTENEGGIVIVFCPNCTLKINPRSQIASYGPSNNSMLLTYSDSLSETKYIFFANRIEFVGTGSYNLSNNVVNFNNQSSFNLYKGMFIARESLTTDYSTTTNIVYGSVYTNRIVLRERTSECNHPSQVTYCFIYQNPNLIFRQSGEPSENYDDDPRYPYIHIMYDPILALRAGEYIGSGPSRYNRSVVGL